MVRLKPNCKNMSGTEPTENTSDINKMTGAHFNEITHVDSGMLKRG